MTKIKKVPIVTVLMPVLNGTSHINEAIDSILNQSLRNFELLIIDDGSEDTTVKKIRSYNDSRIHLILNHKNIGQSKTLNKGLDMARGKYIARMDQDDISMPNRLKKQVEFMEANSNVDVCGSWAKIAGDYDGVLELETESEMIKMNLLTNKNLVHPAVMIRRRTLIINDLKYDPNFIVANDYDLWVRMFDYCTFANLPEPLLEYRVHSDQSSKLIIEKNIHETNKVLQILLNKIGVQTNDSSLLIYKKVFYGYGIETLQISEVFKYLRKLRSSNIRNKTFDHYVFNEFIIGKWRNFMIGNNHRLLYGVLTLLFFRPFTHFKKVGNIKN